MSKGIIGGVIGYLLGAFGSKEKLIALGRISTERRMAKSKYVPPFMGHWVNRGDWDNEDWYYYEHRYAARFVNVVEKDGYVISIDWQKKKEAIAYVECHNQGDAEMEARCFYIDYSGENKVIMENTKAKYFIYTMLKKHKIIIRLTDVEDKGLNQARKLGSNKDFQVLDCIKCLDLEEGLQLLEALKDYYKVYRSVKIEKDIKNEFGEER